MSLPLVGAELRSDASVAVATTAVLYVQAPGFPRTGLVGRLRAAAVEMTMAVDAPEALRLLGEHVWAACLVDLTGGRNALATLRLIRARHETLPLVGVVDATSPTMAAEATHAGLTDILVWPFAADDLAGLLSDLHDSAPGSPAPERGDTLVACSSAMREVLRQVRDLAGTQQAVCVSGQAGSGRTLVAAAMHEASREADGPLVVVDCSGQSPSALEIALFGTGGMLPERAGLPTPEVIGEGSAFARALGGTLVLRHLDEAPSRVQSRLVTLLRDREAVVGSSDRPTDIDVRVVSTVSASRAESDPSLRPDLAARFTARIDVPPLRRRREDIPILAAQCLGRREGSGGRRPVRFSRAALELLGALPWQGNVSELERVVAVIAEDTRQPVVQIEDVLRHVSLDGGPRLSTSHGLREAREQFEREYIEAALARYQGRVGEAARSLGIQRTNLYRKVRQLGISRTLLSSQR